MAARHQINSDQAVVNCSQHIAALKSTATQQPTTTICSSNAQIKYQDQIQKSNT
jgi:hypothetical protein